MKNILKILSVPLIIIAAYGLLYLVWMIFDLPPEDEMVRLVTTWLQSYGLWIIFVSALVEGVLLFGNYYPGGLVIFLGVISAGGDIGKTIFVVLLVCLALFCAYFINYMLGKHGWYRLLIKFGMKDSIERQKQKLEQHQFKAVMGSYWFPNLASITSTAAGILRVPLAKFLIHSAIGVLVWNSLWGTLVAYFGEKIFDMIDLKVIIGVLVVWIASMLIANKRKPSLNQ